MSIKKKLLIIITPIIIVIIGVIAAFIYTKNMLLSPNFSISENTKPLIYVYDGEKIDDVVAQLETKHLVIDTKKIYLAAKLQRLSDTPLKSGCYKITPEMCSWQLVSKIKRREQTPQRLTLNNVRLPEQLAQRVSEQLMVDSATVYNFITDTSQMQSLGFAPNELFVLIVANTYELWWTSSIETIMQRLVTEHNRFWENRDAKAKELGLSRTEIVTLASIVDEETNQASERKRIAGLYLNRLKKGMMLQSDPTVKYAVGDFTLNQILYSHLEIDSPYNTYKYYGLPPGPIRLPQTATIDAVLNAEKHNYIYMCASEKLDGTHHFARTLSEHNNNAAKYHVALRRWKQERKNNK